MTINLRQQIFNPNSWLFKRCCLKLIFFNLKLYLDLMKNEWTSLSFNISHLIFLIFKRCPICFFNFLQIVVPLSLHWSIINTKNAVIEADFKFKTSFIVFNCATCFTVTRWALLIGKSEESNDNLSLTQYKDYFKNQRSS